MTNKEMIIAAIEDLGYKPQFDEEGDISVRYQMKTIYIMSGKEDDKYVAAILPQFTDINEGEETLTLALCNKVSRDLRLAKVYIDQTLQSVSASCEFFYTDEESLKNCIMHSLNILGIVRSTYFKAREEVGRS